MLMTFQTQKTTAGPFEKIYSTSASEQPEKCDHLSNIMMVGAWRRPERNMETVPMPT